MIQSPGRKPSIMEQMVLMGVKSLFDQTLISDDSVVIHHITEDINERLQLEVEYRRVNEDGNTSCTFTRIVVEQ